MICYSSHYRAELVPDPSYTIGSADNRPYDRIINPDGLGRGDFAKVCRLAVERFETGEERQAALIGPKTWCVESCAVLEESRLTVLMDRMVIRLSLDNFEIVCSRRLDVCGSMLALYPCGGDLILHGELEVLRLTRELQTVWTFSGRDLFASLTGERAFCLENGRIRLLDWEGNRYELSLDGELLSDRPAPEKRILTIPVADAASPRELQQILKGSLGLPEWYGMNWDAFWDGITGLIRLPDILILEGWHVYKARWPEDARVMEGLLDRYNREAKDACQVIYRYYR